MKKARGFTLVELLVVISIIAILIATLLPALANAQRRARESADKKRLQQVHAGWTTWAGGEKEGRYPVPGFIDRQTIDVGNGDMNVAGKGKPNWGFNHHALVHSVSIMQNLYSPKDIVASADPSNAVFTYDDYLFEEYLPNPPIGQTDMHWDNSLKIAFGDQDPDFAESHTSFMSSPLHGTRFDKEWRNGGNSTYAAIGSRGPKGNNPPDLVGGDDIPSCYRAYGPEREWVGLIVRNDNAISTEKSFYPTFAPALSSDPEVHDGLYWFECAPGGTSHPSEPNVCSPDGKDSLLCAYRYDGTGDFGHGGLSVLDFNPRQETLGVSGFDNLSTWDPM